VDRCEDARGIHGIAGTQHVADQLLCQLHGELPFRHIAIWREELWHLCRHTGC
jgi:hypothetical protein